MEKSASTPPGAAIITGGARGIGRAIADALLTSGRPVLLVDLDESTVSATTHEFAEQHGADHVAYLSADVRQPRASRAAIEEADRVFGGASVMVNNAGVGRLNPIVEISEDEWDLVVDTSLKATFLFTRAFAQARIAAGGGGMVVNVASLNAFAATDGFGHYCAAKAGVAMLTKVAASELGRHGIRVNAVAPGKTRTVTATSGGEAFRTAGETMEREFVARTPLGRIAEPADIADVVSFLCSDAARWMTGVTVPVDGGNHIRGLHSYWDVFDAASRSTGNTSEASSSIDSSANSAGMPGQ